MSIEKAIEALSYRQLLHKDANMNEKTSYEALVQATSGLKVEDDSTADRKILIAVDFGTTFSGVAWAQTRRVWLLFQSKLTRSDIFHADILTSLMCSL